MVADREGELRRDDLALRLANSVACPACRAGDGLATERDLERFLTRLPEPFGSLEWRTDLARLRLVRAWTRELLDAAARHRRPGAEALEWVNHDQMRVRRSAELAWKDGIWRWRQVHDSQRTSDDLAAHVALSVVRLLTGEQGGKIRACQAAGCAHFVIRRTRNQRWCSPGGCGNRARAARHYAKVRLRQRSTPKPRVPRASTDRPGVRALPHPTVPVLGLTRVEKS